MLRILFSPSEGKNKGGTHEPMHLFGTIEARKEILMRYNQLIASGDKEAICKLFGLKEYEDALPYICDIYTAPTTKAVMRYSGVAYDYLAYETLDQTAQEYIDRSVMIFSNLFGPIQASDRIPLYKVKQTNAIAEIKPELFYKEHFSQKLHTLFEGDEVLDLRAGYYEKFYRLKQPYMTLKFLKNNKIVSHWAKAYRGAILRQMAINRIQTLSELLKMEMEDLIIKEIKEQKNKKEIVYEIRS